MKSLSKMPVGCFKSGTKLSETLNKIEKQEQNDLVKWFIENPNPSDEEVHSLADKQKVDPHVLEGQIYALASVGALILHKISDEKDYDKDQLEMGIEVEAEHLPSNGNEEIKRRIQAIIAMVHIDEDASYYYRDKQGKAQVKGEK